MMDKLFIEGGEPLIGTVQVSGAKNSALPILAATVMLEGETEITNVPYLKDVVTIIKMLNALGVRAEFHKNNRVLIKNTKKVRHIAPYDLVTAMRASFFVAGPLLAKTGLAKVPLPGGCSIGSRPINIHLKGFEEMGATVQIQHGFVHVKAKKLIGATILLDFPSVGATENLMMAACLAEGKTTIKNSAQEPEITDLGNFLISAGAKITGHGSKTITIMGVEKLGGTKYPVIADRIEAGTLLIAGAITNGKVTVENINPNLIESVIAKLKDTGLKINTTSNSVTVAPSGPLLPVDIETQPYPGFPTDMQAQMMTLLTLAKGNSVIKETIFENRFMHAQELMRMGAKIKLDNQVAILTGVPHLSGAEVRITDLRAGAALILAGLAAKGQTTVYGLKHLKRGYENLPEKIRHLGGNIRDIFA